MSLEEWSDVAAIYIYIRALRYDETWCFFLCGCVLKYAVTPHDYTDSPHEVCEGIQHVLLTVVSMELHQWAACTHLFEAYLPQQLRLYLCRSIPPPAFTGSLGSSQDQTRLKCAAQPSGYTHLWPGARAQSV